MHRLPTQVVLWIANVRHSPLVLTLTLQSTCSKFDFKFKQPELIQSLLRSGDVGSPELVLTSPCFPMGKLSSSCVAGNPFLNSIFSLFSTGYPSNSTHFAFHVFLHARASSSFGGHVVPLPSIYKTPARSSLLYVVHFCDNEIPCGVGDLLWALQVLGQLF